MNNEWILTKKSLLVGYISDKGNIAIDCLDANNHDEELTCEINLLELLDYYREVNTGRDGFEPAEDLNLLKGNVEEFLVQINYMIDEGNL